MMNMNREPTMGKSNADLPCQPLEDLGEGTAIDLGDQDSLHPSESRILPIAMPSRPR